ncbi:MAG: hypothetical protein EOO61_07795 [Hymenobacter sp.]|nr:MAG: hypothetical protein EOO61_07795 [Hymenobacter sp.]
MGFCRFRCNIRITWFPFSEICIFVGGTDTAVSDDWAGFHIGQRYELHVKRSDSDVFIMLDYHEHVTPGAGLVMSKE